MGCPAIGLRGKGAGAKIARGGEPADDVTVTLFPHDFGGWCVAFCLPTGTRISVFDGEDQWSVLID